MAPNWRRILIVSLAVFVFLIICSFIYLYFKKDDDFDFVPPSSPSPDEYNDFANLTMPINDMYDEYDEYDATERVRTDEYGYEIDDDYDEDDY